MAAAYVTGGSTALNRVFADFSVEVKALIEKNHMVAIPRGAKAVKVKPRRSKKAIRVVDDSNEEDVIARIAVDFLNTYPNRSGNVSDTTLNLARQAVANGIEAKFSPTKIAALIKDSVGGPMGTYRARMIARTETAAAFNFANLEVVKDMEDSTGPLLKTWVAATDERVRDSHAAADGQQVPLKDAFRVGEDDISFPGDPSGSPEEVINCRCTMVYEPEE
jgi:SPP1 gp7 family putative phage head morphogenesis protein